MNVSNGTGRNGRNRSTFTTKSGKTMKVNRSLNDRRKARKASQAAEKAAYLSTLPKGRFKRTLYRLHPKRVVRYWFSRQGGIMALKIIGISIVVGFFFIIGVFAYFRKDLPQIKNINGENLGGSISYYDSSGKVLLFQDYSAIKRIPEPSDEISPYMKDATVAIEDKNFYKEGAFDIRGITRAAVHDASGGGGVVEGGSTLTQQLVKLNEGWTDDRTLTRKVKELILAIEIEREYTKDQILTAYLNIAPYGGIEYGAEAAAEDYFHTTAANLTLAQASMLASIPQSPAYYSPYGSTTYNSAAGDTFSSSALLGRQHYILSLMHNQGYITSAQEATAESVNVLAEVQPLAPKYQNIQDPYFVLAAKQQLEDQFGATFVNRGGLKVITTLNMQLQNYANQDIASNAERVADVGGDQEAMVAENVKTGQVVAQVGGENFTDAATDGQIDYADTNLSPGSSMKPFLYAALVQNNTDAGAGSVLYDTQQPLPGYPCTNKAVPTKTSDGGNCLFDDNFIYPGPETLRYALAGSRNVPAVKAAYEVDPTDTSSDNYVKSIDQWITLANAAIGVKDEYACYQQGVNLFSATTSDQTQCYGSAALGSGDISLDKEVNGDVTFARLGAEIPQTYILNITDSTGQKVYQWQQPKSTQVYKPDTAYIINSILDDPRASYLTVAQKFQNYNGWDIAVKTGTNNQELNGVMTAWDTQYAVIGFAGYHTLDKPLEEGHFEDITEPITRTWMEQALDALHEKAVNWTAPAGIKTLPSFVERNSTGFGAEVPSPTDDLYPSWYTGRNSGATSEKIDRVSGLLATSCTPSDAIEYEGNANDASFSIDTFYPRAVADERVLEGGNVTSSSTASDNVHNCSDSPPTVTLTAPATCSTSCVITATVTQGTHPLYDPQYPSYPGNVKFTLGGNVIKTIDVTNSPSTVSFTYTPTTTGSATLTATVTDSVLYQGSGSTTLNYTAPATGLTNFNITSSGGIYLLSWSGGTPTYIVYNTSTNAVICPSTQNTNCQAPSGLLPSGTSLTLKDSTGATATATAP